MSRNGSGTYSLPVNSWNPATNAVSATAADWQTLIDDIETALTASLAADGQTPMTGNLAMGNNKLTGLAAGSAAGNSIRYEQVFGSSGLTTLSASGGSALSGFLQIGTGATARTVQAKLRDFISVKDFGATGDGTTDDTAAFTAALATGVGDIYVPRGTYRTTSTIVMGTVGQRLIGSGRSATTILADFQGGAVIEVNEARCSITDMTISTLSGSARRGASPLGVTPPSALVDGNSLDRGIYLDEVGLLTYCHIARCDVVYQPGDGINMAGAGSGTVIEQCGVSYCGGHGMYFDDGDRDGTASTRNGIVDIRDCVIQQCWGHGISLAADTGAALTTFRFNLHNLDVFDVCLGDGGTDQPAFYSTVKAAIAIRSENTRVTQCGVTAETGIIIGTSSDIVLESCRFVTCADYGVIVNPNCSRVKITNPFFTSAPANAGFRVQTGCDNIRIEGVKSTELSPIIDAESETILLVDNKRVMTVAGTNSIWYDEQIKQATISSGVCNIQSSIVDMKGEGDLADSVNQFRFSSGIEVPDGYRFTVCNFNAYSINIQDTTIGGSANIQVQGSTAVLEPGESLSFIVNGGVYYAVGREIP